ncbi:MAG: hypothetical protein ACK55I_10040, partial [bacterium]
MTVVEVPVVDPGCVAEDVHERRGTLMNRKVVEGVQHARNTRSPVSRPFLVGFRLQVVLGDVDGAAFVDRLVGSSTNNDRPQPRRGIDLDGADAADRVAEPAQFHVTGTMMKADVTHRT